VKPCDRSVGALTYLSTGKVFRGRGGPHRREFAAACPASVGALWSIEANSLVCEAARRIIARICPGASRIRAQTPRKSRTHARAMPGDVYSRAGDECKAAGESLSPEQATQAARLRNSGGRFVSAWATCSKLSAESRPPKRRRTKSPGAYFGTRGVV